MGRLRMYNVAFGDGFLLYGEGENLVVDLGSIMGNFNFAPVLASIRAESAGGGLSLLLTHFHKDHWSGLRGWGTVHGMPALRRVYLPDIFKMYLPGRLDLIFGSLLADFLEAAVLNERLSFTLAELLREVIPGLPLEKLRFLSRGSEFRSGGVEYEALWPRLLEEDVALRNSGLEQLLRKLDAMLPAGTESGVRDTLKRLAAALLRDFSRFAQQEEAELLRRDDLPYDALYARAQKLAELLAEALRKDKEPLRRTIRNYISRLRQDWNKISLVFHEQGEGGPLMTGDVPAKTLKDLVDGKYGAPWLRESYDLIKAPHHGTERHFCPALPACRRLLISNGAGHPRYREITEFYEYVYGCRGKGAEILCTNPRCEFIKHTKTRAPGGCGCVPPGRSLAVRW